jgi:hypothetical protein
LKIKGNGRDQATSAGSERALESAGRRLKAGEPGSARQDRVTLGPQDTILDTILPHQTPAAETAGATRVSFGIENVETPDAG